MWGGERERGGEESDDGGGGEEDFEGKWEGERVWQERTRRSRGGLICCCSGSPGAVWLFWKQVSWGESPASCVLTLRPPGGVKAPDLGSLLPLERVWHTNISGLVCAHFYLLSLIFFSYWLKQEGMGGGGACLPAAENSTLWMWFSVAGVVGRKSLG